MPSRPVAALESQGRVLLAALGVEAGGKIPVVTEDGRAFEYPSARVLWRATALTVPDGSKRDVGAALKALRAGLPAPPPWEELRGVVPTGVPLDIADLVAKGDDRSAAALALKAAEGGPWFRLLNGRLVGCTAEEIAACAAAASAAERAAAAEAALAGLLAGKAGTVEAAAPALDRLLGWALGPEDAERPAIAVRLGFADVYEATERLDAAGLLPPDAVPSLSRRGIPRTFPRKVRETAAPPDAAAREDLRALETFAIDDPATTEVDDALSVVRGPGGEPRLLVHIADAAAAVPPGGAVDLEARRRAVTAYLPDLRVPMLPPDLTAARISLEKGEERGALTAEIRAGADGAPEAVRIFRSLVRVGRRCGYAETTAALPEPLRPLEEMARAFRAARVAAGARVLEVPSLHLRVAEGIPVLEERAVTGLGDLAVAEAAVAFNRAAAAALKEAGAAAVWRVQDPPRGDLPDRADPLFSLRARRLFAPVRFSLVPGPHSGIGAPFYLQATSPIRRYTDLLHQRQLAAILAGEAPPHAAAEVREMVDGLYRQERLVRAAEADREDYWLAAWLEARRGEVFDAFVSRPVQRGRGHAWIPRMLLERPFRWPKEGPAAPPEGAPIRLRPGRLSRHRGRVEFEA